MTGSHGFVGTNLIEALSREHEVIRWNVREDRPLPDVDVIIHLAGLAQDTKRTKEIDIYFDVNTELTKRLYDRYLVSTAKKFIFFSSIKAQDGDTAYAKSKKAAEEYIINTTDCADCSDCTSTGSATKRVYILRPCMIHGPGNKKNLFLLYNIIKKGFPWPLAAYNNKRSYASIGNVEFIIEKLINSGVESGIYNVCDDDPVSTNELIRIICECMNKKAKLWRIPKRIMSLFAKIGDFTHLPLNSERLSKLTESYVVDNNDIKCALCIDKLPIKSKEGLRYTIECMMKE